MAKITGHRVYPRVDGLWGIATQARTIFGVQEEPFGVMFAPETFQTKEDAIARLEHINQQSVSIPA